MKKALVIGCGRIGALCDLEPSNAETSFHAYSHAKGLYNSGIFELYFYDHDHLKAEKVAKHYKGLVLKSLDEASDYSFTYICIAAPTAYHYDLYKRFAGKAETIIIEKPLSNTITDCLAMREVYEKSGQRTFVNYMRNLLPQYARLKEEVSKLDGENPFTEIHMTYHRGLINNGSHALACASYILNHIITIEKPQILSVKKFNEIPDDPSISFTFRDQGREFTLLGLEEVHYPVLDILLYSKTHLVKITKSGNTLQIFRKTSNDIYGIMMEEIFREEKVLENFMGTIILSLGDHNSNTPENFLESCALNLELLKVCQSLQ